VFDAEAYKQRNTVERAFNKLKTFRAVAMRTDKREFVFQGTIDVASIKIWLRDKIRQTRPNGASPQPAEACCGWSGWVRKAPVGVMR
jgi:hypothetical protein